MGDVLLLNASYEPLRVVSAKRALALMLRGRVDPVSEENVSLRAPSGTLKVPVIIRLQRYVNVPRRGVSWSRQGIFKRDRFRCIYCGIRPGGEQSGKILTKKAFTIDHIIARSRGGKNTWGNTACACGRCNQRKGNRSPHEAGMPLLWEPKMPRVDYVVASGQVPTVWKMFLETSK